MSKVSVKMARAKELAREKKIREEIAKGALTMDSFQNFAFKLGVGADNALTSSTYGFNPITRNRTLLEWMHRGSWIAGIAIDVVADDMTRAGVRLEGGIKPEDAEDLHESVAELGCWDKLNEACKWGRLYGGTIAVLMVDGQDPRTPLRPEAVPKNGFKGVLVLDRWMVEPSLEDLVKIPGPDIGMPKFYRVVAGAPAMPSMTIHYSRVIRFGGVPLPYWQRVQENMWDLSVLERLYDRLIGFDSASTGAAQLVYKSYLRTFKIDGMREIVAAGNKPLENLVKYVDMARRFQGIEGMTVIDGKDEFEATGHNAFSGLSDVLHQFGEQLSGALQVPLVRLFGQAPGGLSADGDSALRTYYDGINQQQVRVMGRGIVSMYRLAANSMRMNLPDGFRVKFNSLWQMTDTQKAEIAGKVAAAVTQVEEAGIIDRATAMRELRQSSESTNIFGHITDEAIDEAELEGPPPPEDDDLAQETPAGDPANEEGASPTD